MPGITTVQGSQPVEYVEETTFASAEADGAYNWIGLVNSVSTSIVTEEEIVKYLPDDTNAIDLQTLTAEQVSQLHEIEVTYHPQDLGFLDYFMGASGSLSNTLTSIQIGQQDKNNSEFSRTLGCVGEEISISISEDSVAEITASFLAADAEDWTGTDYVGAGSHATATDPATTPPLSYDDLGTVQWGGASLNHAIESLDLTISNDLVVVKDPDATTASHVDAITPVDREITLDLSLTYGDMSLAEDVRSFTKQDFTFNWGPASESWTVSDVAFPEAPYEFGPEDLVSDSVSSVPATDLAYA